MTRRFPCSPLFRGLGEFVLLTLGACSSSPKTPTGPDAATQDASRADDSAKGAKDASDAMPDVNKAATCADAFGQAISTVGFARFDGTVVAIVPPNDQSCAEPNSTHLVIQIDTEGAVYRMVVDVSDVDSTGTIFTRTLDAPLVGDAWSSGWHTASLDYVSTLMVHSTSFMKMSTGAAVTSTTSALELGAKVSIYATAQGEADSAHLVHRNLTNQDGAIVVNPESKSPTWLLFAFSNQTF